MIQKSELFGFKKAKLLSGMLKIISGGCRKMMKISFRKQVFLEYFKRSSFSCAAFMLKLRNTKTVYFSACLAYSTTDLVFYLHTNYNLLNQFFYEGLCCHDLCTQ
jgi:hypothetical protein